MAAAVRYVKLRGDTYQYVRRVPTMIAGHERALREHFDGKGLWRKSLRTRDQHEMYRAASEAHADFESRRQAAIRTIEGKTDLHKAHSIKPAPIIHLRPVTQDVLDELEARIRSEELSSLSQIYLRADGDPASAELLEEMVHQYELDAADRKKAILTPGFEDDSRPWLPSPVCRARTVVEHMKLDAPTESTAFGALVSAIRRGYLLGGQDVGEMLAGKAKPHALAPRADATQSAKPPLFSEAVAAYTAHASLAARSRREIETCSAEFIALVGDKRVTALSRQDFVSYVKFRAGRVVGGRSKGAVQRPASAATVNKSLGFLRSALRHVIEHDDFAFAGPNPASGIKIERYVEKIDKAAMPDKRGFKVGELNKILQHPWFTGCHSETRTHKVGTHRLIGSEYWVPIVAMFSGARCAELGGLRVAETKLDDPHPHFVIRDNKYRTTKGGYARCVPILDALIDLGFGDYWERVRATDVDRLFPDWTPPVSAIGDDAAWYNSSLVKAFNRTVIPARLGDELTPGARREVTFHSFRGAFKALLGSARYGLHPNIINEVIGHSKSELDERYVGTIPIEETYGAVRACRYEGLKLPLPPQERLL